MTDIKFKDYDKFRYEKKFLSSELDIKQILFLIKMNPAGFSEIFYERRVNNIYLDSLDLKNYNENLDGSSQRLKIRIRWYGDTFGTIKNPVLELKMKNSELGTKISFPLKSFVLESGFDCEKLKEIFLDSHLPAWLAEKLKIYFPSLLNSYKRRYFMSLDKKHRITLDWDMIFYRIKNKKNLFLEKIEDKQTCILEVKYLFKHDEEIRNISKHLPFRLTANSKYINGINLFNL